MKNRKWYQIGLFVLACILANCVGRTIAVRYDLPLWMDSFGTVCCAYLLGSLCGAMVGATGNLICGFALNAPWVYAFTSIVLAAIVGMAARRHKLNNFFGTMTVSSLATVASVVISTPLNLFYENGMTGNLWGDGVVNYLREQNIHPILSMVAGQFYIDFVDKVLTLILLYLVLKLYRGMRRLTGRHAKAALLSALVACVSLSGLLRAEASEPSPTPQTEAEIALDGERADAEPVSFQESLAYNDYVQTVFSSSNGLPPGEANDIAATHDGILWIGTYAGLYRYNGREFRWMDGYESVRNVNCLYADSEGRLWIGTNDNGLSILIDGKIVNVVDQSDGLPSNSVRSIIESSDGYYYIGTTGSMQILTLNSGMKKVASLWEVNYADNTPTRTAM